MLSEVKLVADVFVRFENKVLLVRYKNTAEHDNQAGWFLPEGYLRKFDHPAETCKRIMIEQLGLDKDEPEFGQGFTESFRGDDDMWHLVFHMDLLLDEEPDMHIHDGIAEARWFDLDELPARRDVAHGGWALSSIGHFTGSTEISLEAE